MSRPFVSVAQILYIFCTPRRQRFRHLNQTEQYSTVVKLVGGSSGATATVVVSDSEIGIEELLHKSAVGFRIDWARETA